MKGGVKMNINQTTNLNFNAAPKTEVMKKTVTRFRVPGKNNTTIVADLTVFKDKCTNLEYRVMKKGKVLEEKAYQNKRGFPTNRLFNICDRIQTKVREGFDFLVELIDAQFKANER